MLSDLWTKLKADVMNGVALVGTTFGTLLSHVDSVIQGVGTNIDAVAAALGDPNLTQQMQTVIGDAKWFGRWMLAVGIVATIARFKKLLQSPPKE